MNRPSDSGIFLYKDCNMSGGEYHEVGPGTVSVFSRRSPEKSELNEDSAAIVNLNRNSCVLIVADGVGGLPAGAQASAMAVDIIAKRIIKDTEAGIQLRDLILSGIEEANRKIIDMGSGAATTLAIVEIQDHLVRTYHIGDSIILITGQRGKLKMETIPHSPTGYALHSGVLSEEEAIEHDERHLVSNVVGAERMHISLSIQIEMDVRDTLLLASDGLSDNVQRDEIVEMIRKNPLDICTEKLSEYTMKRMAEHISPSKPDDLTFILYRPAT